MQLFRGQQRKTFSQIKPHLITENTSGTGAGAIAFVAAFLYYMLEKIEVLFHEMIICLKNVKLLKNQKVGRERYEHLQGNMNQFQ